MSNLTLQLDGDALREATVQAMLGVLTQDVKNKMLENAIQNLLAPSTDTWSRNKSPLEIAFNDAVIQLARIETKRMIEEDSVMRERIKELMRVMVDKILCADMDKLAERMADAFVASMRRD